MDKIKDYVRNNKIYECTITVCINGDETKNGQKLTLDGYVKQSDEDEDEYLFSENNTFEKKVLILSYANDAFRIVRQNGYDYNEVDIGSICEVDLSRDGEVNPDNFRSPSRLLKF